MSDIESVRQILVFRMERVKFLNEKAEKAKRASIRAAKQARDAYDALEQARQDMLDAAIGGSDWPECKIF